jgi:hypothetical protein
LLDRRVGTVLAAAAAQDRQLMPEHQDLEFLGRSDLHSSTTS